MRNENPKKDPLTPFPDPDIGGRVASPSPAARLTGFICLFALLFIGASSCRNTGPNVPETEAGRIASEIAFWNPHQLYLSPEPYRSLHVEVDVVEGTAPSFAHISALRTFLLQYCKKPEGIHIKWDDVIPRRIARKESHSGLALRYIDGPPPGAAFLYVLYFDSSLNSKMETKNPHVSVLPYPCAIYIDRQYNPMGAAILAGHITLLHEAGHILGLTRNERHSDGVHCTNEFCLMQAKIRISPHRALAGLSPTEQNSLCQDCYRDIMSSRRRKPASNLRFDGPFLMRKEKGYQVAALPDFVHLRIGELDSKQKKEIWTEIRQNTGLVRGGEGLLMNASAEGSDKEILQAIQKAKEDPYARVRELATTLEKEFNRSRE